MSYLRVSLTVASTSFFIGVIYGLVSNGVREEVVGVVIRELRPIAEGVLLNPMLATLLILLNNLRVALIAFLTGPTLVLPLAISFINGYVVGLFLNYGSRPITTNLILILPHGILEIPAILLSTSLGVSLALATIRKYLFKHDVCLSDLLVRYARYLPLITLLLIIAAFIEVYLTPYLYWVIVK